MGSGQDIKEDTEARLSALRARMRELTAENARLSREAEGARVLAHALSHEFRAPLRAIQGVAEALKEDHQELDTQGRDYAGRIARTAARLDQVVLDLLTYLRLERELAAPQACSLDASLSEARARLDAEIRAGGAAIEARAPLGAAMGTMALFDLILVHLISNALKFVDPGVRPRVRLTSERKGAMVRLWVEDNGIGIRQDQQEDVFRVLERLHEQEKYAGSGLGLSVVRRAAEMMGGRAGVESRPGAGSRFWVELPAPPVAL